jgi:hypothetical protein
MEECFEGAGESSSTCYETQNSVRTAISKASGLTRLTGVAVPEVTGVGASEETLIFIAAAAKML